MLRLQMREGGLMRIRPMRRPPPAKEPGRIGLKKASGLPEAVAETAEERRTDPQKLRNPIVCRRCLHEIAATEDMTTVNGAHRHVFTNPAGVTYQIGCYAAAGGCTVYGAPTFEFTWFPGYAWSIALCANCLLHLGWHYRSASSAFFGLIADHLVQQTRLH